MNDLEKILGRQRFQPCTNVVVASLCSAEMIDFPRQSDCLGRRERES